MLRFPSLIADEDTICNCLFEAKSVTQKLGPIYAPSITGVDMNYTKFLAIEMMLKGGADNYKNIAVSVVSQASYDSNNWFDLSYGKTIASGDKMLYLKTREQTCYFNHFRVVVEWDGDPSWIAGHAVVFLERIGARHNNILANNIILEYENTCDRCGGKASTVTSEGLFGEKYTGKKCHACGWIG